MSNKLNYTVVFPLELGMEDIGYKSVFELRKVINFNIKSTLLTNPGERISDPSFGVGLLNFLFEFPTPGVIQTIKSKISQQLKTYVNFIRVKQIDIQPNAREGKLDIKIGFRILTSKLDDSFEMAIDLNQIW